MKFSDFEFIPLEFCWDLTKYIVFNFFFFSFMEIEKDRICFLALIWLIGPLMVYGDDW